MKNYYYVLLLLPFISVAVSYFQVLSFGYIWDDAILIEGLKVHPSRSAFDIAFKAPFFVSPNYYRPIVFYSIITDMYTHGGNALIPHLKNIALHLLNLTLLAYLLQKLIVTVSNRSKYCTMALCLLMYGLHPALVESVAWVSGRFDLLMTTFLLAVLVVEQSQLSLCLRFLGVSTFFLCAALCKEMAVAFCLALPVFHAVVYRDIPLRKLWFSLEGKLLTYSALFFSGLVYVGLRYLALGYLLVSDGSDNVSTTNETGYLTLVFQAVHKAVLLLILPFSDLALFYDINKAPFFENLSALAGLVFVVATILGIINTRGIRGYVGIAVCLLLSVIPVIHIVPLSIGENVVQSRFLVLPLSLTCLLLALQVTRIDWGERASGQKAFILKFTFSLWLIISIGTTLSVIPLWAEERLLWQWSYQKSQQPMVKLFYAKTLLWEGDPRAAVLVLNTMEDGVYSLTVSKYFARANAHENLGQLDSAKRDYKKVLSLGNERRFETTSHIRLARILGVQGYYSESVRHLEYVIGEHPRHLKAHSELCILYSVHLVDSDKATNVCQAAIDIVGVTGEQGLVQEWLSRGVTIQH